ncbi:MAG: hypothetical protein LBR97_02490 [Dysgonamonadaceae bacterium]|nr:hypothetical protein [Dysgonamonadaceae bacterium]
MGNFESGSWLLFRLPEGRLFSPASFFKKEHTSLSPVQLTRKKPETAKIDIHVRLQQFNIAGSTPIGVSRIRQFIRSCSQNYTVGKRIRRKINATMINKYRLNFTPSDSDTDANLTHWIGSVNSYLGTCKRYDTYRFREQLVKRFKKDPIVVFNIEKGNSTSKKDLAVFVASFHLKSEKHPLCCFTIWNCVVMWLPD